jgi:hypothetical protein
MDFALPCSKTKMEPRFPPATESEAGDRNRDRLEFCDEALSSLKPN